MIRPTKQPLGTDSESQSESSGSSTRWTVSTSSSLRDGDPVLQRPDAVSIEPNVVSRVEVLAVCGLPQGMQVAGIGTQGTRNAIDSLPQAGR